MNMPTKKTKPVPYYSSAAVADKLGVSPRIVQRWCTQGRFAGAFKLGTATSPWRIPVAAFDRFIKERKESAQAGEA